MTFKIHPKAGGFMEVQLDAADLELETFCPGTTGEGCTLGKLPGGSTCPTCHGRGLIPTALGLAILGFCFRYAPWYREQQKISNEQNRKI